MIGVFGLVLRWTFARDRRASEAWPQPSPPPSSGRAAPAVVKAVAAVPPAEDFGLLAPVAVVDTEDEAAQVRELLTAAGIRSTQNITNSGRLRVLVFTAELDRARRVSGWSP
jgi:hypothetical protein